MKNANFIEIEDFQNYFIFEEIIQPVKDDKTLENQAKKLNY